MSHSVENIAFFKKYSADLTSIFSRENGRRLKTGFEGLTEEEIDGVVTSLLIQESSGKPIKEWVLDFPAPKIREDSVKLENKKTETPQIIGKRYKFDIFKCENGFLMTVESDNKQQYIFKNIEELTEIFRSQLFKTVVLKEIEKQNGIKPCLLSQSKKQKAKELKKSA